MTSRDNQLRAPTDMQHLTAGDGIDAAGEPPAAASRVSGSSTPWAAHLRHLPGLWVAAVISLAATFIAEHSGGPPLLYALFIGIALNFLYHQSTCHVGIEFASKGLLRFAVGLLGARITFGQLAGLGWWPVFTVCLATGATLMCGLVCARLLGRTREEGILSGGAVGICGASAALAIAAVLPPGKDNERLTLLTAVGVTGLSTLAMILYPMLAALLHLDAHQTGIFFGATIHNVPQVVGAGYMVSPEVGDVATYVKLSRVTLLVPVVLCCTFVFRAERRAVLGREKSPVPPFLLGFVTLVAINSTGVLPAEVTRRLSDVSHWCLTVAISALGVKTSFQQLASLGWRPVAMLIVNTVFLASLVLALLWLERFL